MQPPERDIPNHITPPETNMSPENQWLEDVFPIEIVPFKGTFVSFPGCIPITLDSAKLPPPGYFVANEGSSGGDGFPAM